MPGMAATALRLPREPVRVVRDRITLRDGARTTVYVRAFDAARTDVRVAVLRGQARLEPWCADRGIYEAVVGGFFTRPAGVPLGEVRTRGIARRHIAFDA